MLKSASKKLLGLSKVFYSSCCTPPVVNNTDPYCYCNCECERCLCGPGKVVLGKPAPDFKKDALLPDGTFGEIKLEDYKDQWALLFFYPLDFTFVCPTEILAFSDAKEEFEERNCAVIAASVDSVFSHYNWVQQDRAKGGISGMSLPMISDLTKTMARDYGVLTDEGYAARGLFLIDPDQNVKQIIINDGGIGRSVEEALRLLDANQFTREHGEVCPANWKKGEDAMKPSIEESKEYFEKH